MAEKQPHSIDQNQPAQKAPSARLDRQGKALRANLQRRKAASNPSKKGKADS